MKQREFLKLAERVNAKITRGTRRLDFRWNWDEEYAKGLSNCPNCGSVLAGNPHELLRPQPKKCWQCRTESVPYDASSGMTRLVFNHILSYYPYLHGIPALLRIGRIGRRVVNQEEGADRRPQ